MAHKQQDTSTDAGLENSIRQSWSAGDKVKILSAVSNDWVSAHIVAVNKDTLYCLLDDTSTKKINRWDATVQPFPENTNTTFGGGGEDDEEEFWLKDGMTTPSGA